MQVADYFNYAHFFIFFCSSYNIAKGRSSITLMTDALSLHNMSERQNESIAEAVKTNRPRLRDFIRQRVADIEDAEDILQDVFEELTEAVRMMQPIEQVASWMFRVARNKIIDRYRKKKTESLEDQKFYTTQSEDEQLMLADLLADTNGSSANRFDNSLLWNAIEEALDELPPEQRNVFVWHEIDGKSFNSIAEETGIPLNTLLSRKRYAVLHLRKKLRDIYNELFN
jgi:RNA polymerase sigma factor (sigma-70 family)